jgi:hypothetical protein
VSHDVPDAGFPDRFSEFEQVSSLRAPMPATSPTPPAIARRLSSLDAGWHMRIAREIAAMFLNAAVQHCLWAEVEE